MEVRNRLWYAKTLGYGRTRLEMRIGDTVIELNVWRLRHLCTDFVAMHESAAGT